MKSGNAWFEGTAEFDMEGQIPGIYKEFVGMNPLIAVPNALKIIAKGEDIYGSEASTKIDKLFAGASLISPLNPGKALFGQTQVGKLIDRVNPYLQFTNDVGLIDEFKEDTSSPID